MVADIHRADSQDSASRPLRVWCLMRDQFAHVRASNVDQLPITPLRQDVQLEPPFLQLPAVIIRLGDVLDPVLGNGAESAIERLCATVTRQCLEQFRRGRRGFALDLVAAELVHGLWCQPEVGDYRDLPTLCRVTEGFAAVTFDFSHNAHREVQSLMWCRTAAAVDKLITLLTAIKAKGITPDALRALIERAAELSAARDLLLLKPPRLAPGGRVARQCEPPALRPALEPGLRRGGPAAPTHR